MQYNNYLKMIRELRGGNDNPCENQYNIFLFLFQKL